MSKIITGTNAADTITVKESDVTVNAGLGNDSININSGSRNKVRGQQDNDTLTVNGGSNSFIWGGSGSDTIAVNSGIGTGNKIYGEADADTITVNGGSGNYINGGGGVDIITFNGGSKNEFYAEREDDIIHVYGGSENKICGGSGYDVIDIGKSVGLNNKIHGDGGKDRITLFGGKGNEIHGGSGSDVIKVTGGSNNVVRGEQDHDTITVTGGDKNKIYGGSGMDTLIIETTIGTGNYLYGEAGEDKITVKGGSGNYINGGGDIDTVIFAGGSDNKFYGERGNDTITVKGGENNLICGGSENDEIAIENGVGTGNKIYGDAGQDTIVVNGGSKNEIHGGSGDDAIYVKGGSNNTVYGDKGNDTIEIHAGSQLVDGGSGNDLITVRGGNNHTVKGGTGSDLYTIVPVLTSDTSLKINQKDLDSGDADVLHFQSVQRKEVRFTLENGTLKIVHTSGGNVSVSGWQENPIETIIFADGKTLTGAEVTRLAETYEIDWDLGNTVSVTLSEFKKGIRVNGYKENDFVITLNEAGELILTDAKHGKITVSNWKGSPVQFVEFSSDDYVKAFTAEEINEQLFNVAVLGNNSSYTGGKAERQEFSVNLTPDTNITINSASDTSDRIKFADDHSLDNASWRISGNDLYINDYVEGSGETGGQIVIKNVKQSSVKDVEFAEAVVHLVPDGNREYIGSDTFRDRYLFLDNVWSGTDMNTADWNVTIDAINSQDVLDFRFLPNNDRYYSVAGTTEGQDLVLKYSYSITPDSGATLGTVRLKNFFDADGTVNAEQGFPRIRMNRSVYAGYTSNQAWDGWVWERDQNHRWFLLNAGTENNDTVDLRELVKSANRSWLYYAGKGDDNITAQEGDIVYGGAGSDTLKLTGSYAEVHGGSDDDTITIQGADGENLDHVVARSGDGNDVIRAYGSNHYINGGYGDDEIRIYDAVMGVNGSQNSVLSGSRGNDTIYIHGGNNHIASGASDDDTIYAYSGNGHRLNGGKGNDEIHIVDDGTKQSDNNRGDGGIGDDRLYIENGGQNHMLFGGDGEDYLSVAGDNNTLDGGNDNDTLVVVNGTNNKLSGGAGNDTLQILAGDNNELHGNEGDDILTGGRGADTLYGNEGNDELHGGAGNDTLYGGTENDILYGDAGNDALYGGAGNDTLYGGAGNNTLNGGAGDDILYGGKYPDTFIFAAGEGNDIIKDFNNNNQPDTLQITNGFITKAEVEGDNVVFTVGSGTVTLEGAKGQTIRIKDGNGTHTVTEDDITVYNDYTGTMNANAYFDTVKTISITTQAKGVTIIGNAQDNTVYGGYEADTLYGGDGDDTLNGNKGDDILNGGNGDDILSGGSGNDTLYGSMGNDTLSGGSDNDTFVFDKDYTGNNTINSYEEGNDVVRFADDIQITGFTFNTETNNAMALDLSTGGTVNVTSVYGKTIAFKDHNDSDFAVVIGTFGNDSLAGTSGNDILYGHSGADTLSGNAGDDMLYGCAGKDTFVYGAGEGNDIIKDYVQNEDTLTITNGLISKTENDAGNLVFTAGSGTVTLEGAADKIITITDANGRYTASAESITLDSDYSGSLDSNAYLSTVVTVDGSKVAGDLSIMGNSRNNVLTGGAGNDVLTGGAGNDTFVYTGGNDIVTDYTENQDILQVSGGAISGMAVTNNNKDIVFTVNEENVTLQNAAGKNFALKDKNGSFTVSGSAITLGSDFTGSMDADIFSADTIYVGDCKGSVLTGGQGADSFIFVNPTGNHKITDYEHGTDVLRFDTDTVIDSAVSGTDVVLTLSGGATVTLQNQATQAVTFTDVTNTEISVNPKITQQSVIKSFMKGLDDSTLLISDVTEGLDQVIQYASNNLYNSWNGLVTDFVNRVQSFGAENRTQAEAFLSNYCGIVLNNVDTGAITGLDAGGPVEKTAESIVPEQDITPVFPATDTTVNGLTFHWPEPADNLEIAVIKGIHTWWAEEGLNLIEESYGLSFTEEGTGVTDITVQFEYVAPKPNESGTLAYVTWDLPSSGPSTKLWLTVNKYYVSDQLLSNVSGYCGDQEYLDRTIAHELTHAVMAANIAGFSKLTDSLREGTAELVHGIDDVRTDDIRGLAYASDVDYLQTCLTNRKEDSGILYAESYAAGYMALRYFAKQVADYWNEDSMNYSNGLLAGSFADSISTATSSFRSDGTAAVANAGSELASSLNDVSNAMLMPLDSAGANWLGTDSLTSGLFSEKRTVL